MTFRRKYNNFLNLQLKILQPFGFLSDLNVKL